MLITKGLSNGLRRIGSQPALNRYLHEKAADRRLSIRKLSVFFCA